nr:hypothetical protein [Pseudothauera rhizosphaerae]
MVLVACSSPGTAPRDGRLPSFAPQHLAKTDIDRFAEAHQRRVFISLRRLAEKLYRRNPREWRKSGAAGPEEAVARLFDGRHGWRLEELGYRRDIEALQIAFHPEYRGDRVAAFTVGLASMVQGAFGDKVEFYLLDELNAQRIYNAARNVEIAAWKLSTARDERGAPLLLSNEIGEVANLSFEREFGRIIGQLEVLSDVVEEKTERTVTRVVQNMATAVFLPVR